MAAREREEDLENKVDKMNRVSEEFDMLRESRLTEKALATPEVERDVM